MMHRRIHRYDRRDPKACLSKIPFRPQLVWPPPMLPLNWANGISTMSHRYFRGTTCNGFACNLDCFAVDVRTIMGFAFIAERREGTSGMVAISKVWDLIDMVSWLTFRLHQSVGDERFLGWVNWIQDIQAYRNRRKRARMEDPYGSLMDGDVWDVVDRPRDKCKGLLKAGPWLQTID